MVKNILAKKIKLQNNSEIHYINLLSFTVVQEPGTVDIVGVVGGEVWRGDDILGAMKHAATKTHAVTQGPVGPLKIP